MNTQELVSLCNQQFNEKFGENPQKIVLSPGRINIIGEHIDYNHGFVLPAAIDKYICFAISKNDTADCNIISLDLKDEYHPETMFADIESDDRRGQQYFWI